MRLVLTILVSALLFSTEAYSKKPLRPKKKPAQSMGQDLIDANKGISEKVREYSDRLDVALVGKRVTNKKNQSEIVVESNNYISEGTGITNSADINLRLLLPNVEKYWQLRFTSYDENKENRSVTTQALRSQPREKNYGTTIGFGAQKGSLKTTFQPRVELRDPLHISYLFRLEWTYKADVMTIQPKLELFARPDDGTGVFTSIYFIKELNKTFTFRQHNESEYGNGNRIFTTNHGANLAQAITDRWSLAYLINFNSNSRPSFNLNEYALSVSSGHALYRNILNMSLIPTWSFARANNFKGSSGFSLNFQLYF